MKKKGRDLSNFEVLDPSNINTVNNESIVTKVNSYKEEDVTAIDYDILPKFGIGGIKNFKMESIDITIAKFILKKDLLLCGAVDTNYTELSFLMEGEKVISINESNSDIVHENMESYFVNSQTRKSKISGGKSYKEITLKLSNSFLLTHGFMRHIEGKRINDENIIMPITSELHAGLDDLEKRINEGIDKKLFIKAKVFELLALQVESYNRGEGRITNGSNFLKKIYTVKTFLKKNLHRNYTTKELSRKCDISEHVLKVEFKRVFGYSIKRFCANEKMNKAKELLKSPQLTVYQIAEEIGYKNATHFSAAFKRNFGNTPKHFRNNFIKENYYEKE